ncbi:hypothetical protein DIPPA_32066 [Diplonema papillatum]|nr:hypothetical protein DIPPA_32066 [Diplonema papillatum]
MRWTKLSFDNLPEVTKQTDEVATIIQSLVAQITNGTGDVPSSTHVDVLRNLQRSCLKRIAQLETFYADNDLHDDAPAIEQQRLKLKRCLRQADAALERAGHPKSSSGGDTLCSSSLSRQASGEGASGCVEGLRTAGGSAPTASPQGERQTSRLSTQLRIRLTPKEYEEIVAKREAYRQLRKPYLGKGFGSQAWENNSISTAHAQSRERGEHGLYSEMPYVDPSSVTTRPAADPSKWVAGSDQPFCTVLQRDKRSGRVPSVVTGSSAGPFLSSRAEVVMTRPNDALHPVDPTHDFKS